MGIETDDDRATLLDTKDFATTVVWTRAGVDQPAFAAQFSRPSVMVDIGEDTAIDREASLWCRAIDLPSGATEGDAVAVAGEEQTFSCRSIRPDGTGMAFIDLARAT